MPAVQGREGRDIDPGGQVGKSHNPGHEKPSRIPFGTERRSKACLEATAQDPSEYRPARGEAVAAAGEVVAVVVEEEVVVVEEVVVAEESVAVAGLAEGEPAAGPVEVGSAREGCRVHPGAGSAHALPVIPESPINPASPASIGTALTVGPA